MTGCVRFRMRRIIGLALVALLASACGAPVPAGRGARVWHGAAYKQVVDWITVVHLKGTDAQIREQYLALLSDEIAAAEAVLSRNRVLRAGGCTNFAAFGPAAADGKVWHGRAFDFYGIGAMDRYKVVSVVEPAGGIPYMSVNWANRYGYDWVHTAMNAEGVSLGYMWGDAVGERIWDAWRLWALFRRVIERAHTLAEAVEIVTGSERGSAANLLIADAKIPDSVVVEMTSRRVAVRRAKDGVVYATNHFVSPTTRQPIKDPHSEARYRRIGDLLASHRGRVDLTTSVSFLRDRYDVLAGRESFTGDVIAWNMNVLAVVFSPGDLTFWVAKGMAPAVYSEFVGFSLKAELSGGATRLRAVPEDPVIRTAAYRSFLAYQEGYVAAMEGDYSRAVERIREAIPGDPRSGRYRYTLANAYMNLGRYPEAIQTFREVLAADADEVLRAYTYFRLGQIYQRLGDRAKMREAYTKVLAFATGEPEIEGPARAALEGAK